MTRSTFDDTPDSGLPADSGWSPPSRLGEPASGSSASGFASGTPRIGWRRQALLLAAVMA
jgi:hypothetical protein